MQPESKLSDFNPFRYALLILLRNPLWAGSFIPKPLVRSGHVLGLVLSAGERRVDRAG